jgi:hypothetical protein
MGFAAEGTELTAGIADSGLTTPRIRSIFSAFSGAPGYLYGADFDVDGVVEKVGILSDPAYSYYPEAMVSNGFDDVPILFMGGAADPRAFAGSQAPIAEAAAVGLNNPDWIYDGIRQAVANQPDSPHQVTLIDGAGHTPSNKPGVANDIVDDFISQILSTDPPYPFEPDMKGDLDYDGDADGQDFLTFSVCYNGSLNPPSAACENTDADFDEDGDVDGNDFLTFSVCYNGSLNPPRVCE